MTEILVDDFMAVIPRYTEAHRHYHNLDHLMTMFKAHEKYRDQVPIDWNLFLEKRLYQAIVYHDVVYNIGLQKASNELQSARLYQEVKGQSSDFDSGVPDLILATEHHFTPDLEFDTLTSYLLDLDLISLATKDEAYLMKTQENIENEFRSQFPEEVVMRGRYDFVTKLLMPYGHLRVLTDTALVDQFNENKVKLVRHYAELI